MKRTKILLVNVWSDRNKGDYAITLGTIKLLKSINSNIIIYAMSLFGANEFKFLSSEHKLLSSHVDKVVGGLYPTYISYGYEKMTRVRQRILDIYSFLSSFVRLILVSISRRIIGSRILPLEELSNSDLVIVVGGNYIYSSNVFGAMFYLFRVLYPVFICIILRKPYVILGHTIWNINDRLSKALLRFVIDRATFVTVREKISYEVLKFNVKTRNRVFVLPELAFALADEVGTTYTTVSRDTLVVGFSIRGWDFQGVKDSKRLLENYRTAISQFISFLRTRYDAEIVLIPLGSGPLYIEHDASECLEILKRVSHLGKIYVSPTPQNLQDIFKLYSSLDLHIGVRLHSVLFAFMCGVPSIAIGYQGHKTIGIINQLGLSKYYLDIADINCNRLKLVFETLLRENNHVRKILSSKAEEIRLKLLTYKVLLSQLFNHT